MLEAAQKSAKVLLDKNRDNPAVCAKINEKLSSVSVPLSKLLTNLADKQKRLDRVKKASEKYEAEKEPLEEYITETTVLVDESEPFGIDVEQGEKKVEELKVRIFIYAWITLNTLNTLLFFKAGFLARHTVSLCIQ